MLTVSLPPVIDRRQMVVVTTTDQLLVLEHQRWAAPLSELVAQTLARDIEERRADVLVADRSFDQASLIPVKIRVDVVRMSVREGGASDAGSPLARGRCAPPYRRDRRGNL